VYVVNSRSFTVSPWIPAQQMHFTLRPVAHLMTEAVGCSNISQSLVKSCYQVMHVNWADLPVRLEVFWSNGPFWIPKRSGTFFRWGDRVLPHCRTKVCAAPAAMRCVGAITVAACYYCRYCRRCVSCNCTWKIWLNMISEWPSDVNFASAAETDILCDARLYI